MDKNLYDEFDYGTVPYDGKNYIERESDGVFYAEDPLVIAAVPPTATGCDFTEAVAVGAGAFSGCTELTAENLNLPNVRFVGAYGFLRCEKLTSFPFCQLRLMETGAFGISGIRNADLSKIITIPQRAFLDCTELNSVKFSPKLKRIGANAFMGCEKLNTVDLPDSVTTIEQEAFCNTGITRIRIPKKLATLSNCMAGYSPLRELEIPYDSELETIEAEAIAGTEVREIYLPNSVREIHDDAFAISPLEEIICNKGSFAERWATNHGYKVRRF